MENLNKDELFLLAMELDLPSILNLCKTSKYLNKMVCENPNLWRSKLNKDYPYLNISEVKDLKGLYLYLKKRAKISDKRSYVSIRFNEFNNTYNMLGQGGESYILKDNNKKVINLSSLKLRFPDTPPEFLEFLFQGDVRFAIHFDKVKEIIENYKDKKSYIKGKYGEIYPVQILGHDDDSKILKTLKMFTRGGTLTLELYFNRGNMFLNF